MDDLKQKEEVEPMQDRPFEAEPRWNSGFRNRPTPADLRRAAHGAVVRFDLDDPLEAMPEPARNLVAAAKRIIARDGLGGLTLNSVAREANENKATTAYYFGNKDGLIATVHDSVIHEEYLDSQRRVDASDREERLSQILQEMKAISSVEDELQVSFELTPHALRNPALRERMRELYAWYAENKEEWLRPWLDGADPDTARGLLELLSAVMDGMALQAMIKVDGFDMNRPYRVLETMLRLYLPRISEMHDEAKTST